MIITKKALKIVTIISASIVLAILVYLSAVMTGTLMTNQSQSFAIIGGADGPTALYLMQKLMSQRILRQPLFWLGAVSLIVCLTSLAMLFIQRFDNR